MNGEVGTVWKHNVRCTTVTKGLTVQYYYYYHHTALRTHQSRQQVHRELKLILAYSIIYDTSFSK
jgi:hypothetical protein